MRVPTSHAFLQHGGREGCDETASAVGRWRSVYGIRSDEPTLRRYLNTGIDYQYPSVYTAALVLLLNFLQFGWAREMFS